MLVPEQPTDVLVCLDGGIFHADHRQAAVLGAGRRMWRWLGRHLLLRNTIPAHTRVGHRNSRLCGEGLDALLDEHVGEALTNQTADGQGDGHAERVVTDRASQGACDVHRVVVALPRIGLEQISDHLFECGGYVGGEAEGAGRQWIKQSACAGLLSCAVTAQDLEEHQAHRIQIGPWAELGVVACPLLGCHPDGSATHALLLQRELGHCACDAEIGDPCIGTAAVLAVEQYVGGLQVLMEEAVRVDMRERIEDLVNDLERFAHGGALSKLVGEAALVRKGQRDEGTPIIQSARVEDGDDPRMHHLRGERDLRAKRARNRAWIARLRRTILIATSRCSGVRTRYTEQVPPSPILSISW